MPNSVRISVSALAHLMLLLVLSVLSPSVLRAGGDDADEKTPRPSFAQRIEGLEAREGLLELHVDPEKGRVLLTLPPAGGDQICARSIYAEYLAGGLGSNPVNLDRGQPGRSLVVAFRRLGNKVLLEAENWGFVADTEDPRERRAVENSFARSTLWATEILAEAEDGRLLVDFTGFLLLDAHGSATKLARTGQGEFRLDAARSAVDLDAALAFPENLEFDARLAFVGEKPGPELRSIVPDPRSVQLIQHHSFLKLPEPGYEPRFADPRAGQNSIPVQDYGSGLSEPIVRHLALRHRLRKLDPAAASSPVVEPIVYYVDPGAPETIRRALIEGGSWWAEAFAAAGFENAFRVEPLPEGVHPLDARYNVVHWVHRQTRGWSYGGSIHDPRTGEILRGNVLLGSLRVRQDRMIFEGLVGAQASGRGGPDDPVEVALARIRQLSAHEIGHTLGLAHNMAASVQDRASVMDYPAPEVGIREDGTLDLGHAYAVGVGAWDRFAIEMLYREFPEGSDVAAELESIARRAYDAGILYVADGDSRPAGTGHPDGALWDTGDDSVESLRHTMAVRRAALDAFGARNLPEGRPWAELRERLVPIYLFHRYQVEAACKKLGGIRFGYAVRGDGHEGSTPVPAVEQTEALDAVLETLDPAELDLPDELLALLTPHEPGSLGPGAARELFAPSRAQAFDLDRAASAAAAITLGHLLHRDRLERVDELHQRDPELPSLESVVQKVVDSLAPKKVRGDERRQALTGTVAATLVDQLMALSADQAASPRVRAAADDGLERVAERLDRKLPSARALRARIARYLEEGVGDDGTGRRAVVPPGSPIGGCGDWHAPPQPE